MLEGYDPRQLQQWKSSLSQYEKEKRTKKPFVKHDPQFYKNHKIIHSQQIKQKQSLFNPLLQTYKNPLHQTQSKHQQQKQLQSSLIKHMVIFYHLIRFKQKSNHKQYQKQYDIVNLHPYIQSNYNNNPLQINNQSQNQHQRLIKIKNKHNPIRNTYNIINNQHLPSFYYKNRNVSLGEKPNSKKVYPNQYQNGQFDIVKAQYYKENYERQCQEREREKMSVERKLKNKRGEFNNILQQYYNPQQQQNYQQNLISSQLHESIKKAHNPKLPLSYINRQPYLPSYNFQQTHLPMPQSLKKIQQKQQQKIKKLQLRYVIEDQYRRRNQEDFEKEERIRKNKVHEGKILQNMIKEHNIINNKRYEMNRSMFFQKKLDGHPYSYEFLKSSQRNNMNDSRDQRRRLKQEEQIRLKQYYERSVGSRGSNNQNGSNEKSNESSRRNQSNKLHYQNYQKLSSQHHDFDNISQAYSARSQRSSQSQQLNSSMNHKKRSSIKSGGFD